VVEWSADIATTNDITTNIAQFGNGGTLPSGATVNVAAQSINSLIFAATTTAGYTLTNTAASTLTIGSGGITMNSGAQAATIGDPINLSLALGASQTWANNSSSALTIAGSVTGGATATTLTLNGTGAGINTISGALANGTAGLAVTKTGVDTWILTGANTYTGATTSTAALCRWGTELRAVSQVLRLWPWAEALSPCSATPRARPRRRWPASRSMRAPRPS